MLIIRADASTAIGTGHVMRTLALAQAWRDQVGKVLFAVAELPDVLQRRLNDEGMLTYRLDVAPGTGRDAQETAAIARQRNAQWVVVDGYRFNCDYRSYLFDDDLNVLRVEDFGDAQTCDASLLLNQNLGATRDLYPAWTDSHRLLLGPHYALVRRELADGVAQQRVAAGTASRILVTLGGSDPDNQTLKVVKALRSVPNQDLEAAIIIGASNPHSDALRQAAAEDDRLRLHFDVQNMAALLSWADIAIAAAGSSAWERALFGLPSLIMILADNQVPIAEALDGDGWSTNLGWSDRLTAPQLTDAIRDLLNDPQRRELQCQRSRRAVDGQGASRTVGAMLQWNDKQA